MIQDGQEAISKGEHIELGHVHFVLYLDSVGCQPKRSERIELPSSHSIDSANVLLLTSPVAGQSMGTVTT